MTYVVDGFAMRSGMSQFGKTSGSMSSQILKPNLTSGLDPELQKIDLIAANLFKGMSLNNVGVLENTSKVIKLLSGLSKETLEKIVDIQSNDYNQLKQLAKKEIAKKEIAEKLSETHKQASKEEQEEDYKKEIEKLKHQKKQLKEEVESDKKLLEQEEQKRKEQEALERFKYEIYDKKSKNKIKPEDIAKKEALTISFSDAQQALKKSDLEKYENNLKKGMSIFLKSYFEFNNKIIKNLIVPSEVKPKASPSFIVDFYVKPMLENTNFAARSLNALSIAKFYGLGSSDRRKVSTDLFKSNMIVGLATLQTHLIFSGSMPFSDEYKDSLSLVFDSSVNTFKQPMITDVFVDLYESNHNLLQNMSAKESNSMMLKVVKDIFVNPLYRKLIYPITAQSLIESDSEISAPRLNSLIPLLKVMLIPALAEDKFINDAVDLILLSEQNKIDELPQKIDLFLSEIKEMKLYKTGEINEVALLANIDLLHKFMMLLLVSFMSQLEFALIEINKTPADMLESDFDNKIVLYKEKMPVVYNILKNRNKMMGIMSSCMNVYLDLLGSLADNFGSFSLENQQLALEAGIAAEQLQLVFKSPLLLGAMAPAVSAITQSSSMPKIANTLVASALELPKKTEGGLSIVNNLGMMTLVLKNLVIKPVKQKIEEKLQEPEHQEQMPVNKKKKDDLQRILSQLKTSEQNSLKTMQNMVQKEKLKSLESGISRKEFDLLEDAIQQKIDDSKKGIQQSLKKIDKQFMDDVEKKASAWFAQLPNKKDIIRFADVAKVVSDNNYDNGQILYINGFLQAMAL